MRLYLASYRTDTVQPLLDLAGAGARAVVVSNALDLIPDADHRAYAARVHDPVADLRDAGLAAEPLDLRAYFGKPGELERALAGVGLVWAVGGAAFLLRRAMAQSGLDQILLRRLAEDSLVYGGWSAGACVAGSTLRGLRTIPTPSPPATTPRRSGRASRLRHRPPYRLGPPRVRSRRPRRGLNDGEGDSVSRALGRRGGGSK